MTRLEYYYDPDGAKWRAREKRIAELMRAAPPGDHRADRLYCEMVYDDEEAPLDALGSELWQRGAQFLGERSVSRLHGIGHGPRADEEEAARVGVGGRASAVRRPGRRVGFAHAPRLGLAVAPRLGLAVAPRLGLTVASPFSRFGRLALAPRLAVAPRVGPGHHRRQRAVGCAGHARA